MEPSISNGNSGSMSISVVGAFAHVKHASGRTSADIVRSVSTSDAWACTARAERFQRPTGFPTSSPLPTTQSKAFFSVPGTPWAYSGLEITTAAAAFTCARKAITSAGPESVSRSGLKWGRRSSKSQSRTSVSGSVTREANRKTVVFRDLARRLPEIARILMSVG